MSNEDGNDKQQDPPGILYNLVLIYFTYNIRFCQPLRLNFVKLLAGNLRYKFLLEQKPRHKRRIFSVV
jgi:hypothetical protein